MDEEESPVEIEVEQPAEPDVELAASILQPAEPEVDVAEPEPVPVEPGAVLAEPESELAEPAAELADPKLPSADPEFQPEITEDNQIESTADASLTAELTAETPEAEQAQIPDQLEVETFQLPEPKEEAEPIEEAIYDVIQDEAPLESEQVRCHTEQGRIHGYPSRVRVGRSSAGEGHWVIWAGAVCSTSHPRIAHGQRYPMPCWE